MNYATLPTFASHDAVHVVVESHRGAMVKLKYDSALEVFTLSRPLPEGVVFPYDFGFIPSTAASDGDPLDALIVWDRASYPGVVLPCRLIGVLTAEQNSKRRPGTRERNDRLIAVPMDAPRLAAMRSIADLAPRTKEEIASFFLASTAFEKKDLVFGGWSDADVAYALVREAASHTSR